MKVPFVETLKLKVLKAEAGKSHSLIQVVDENGKKKMFSLGGRNENMFRYLGVSKELAAGEQTYHEITAFSELEVIDFSATKEHSMIIMAGEDKPTDNLYVHKLPGGEARGLIHFYQKEDGSWVFLSEEQYDEAVKEGTVPDCCFATKHPIKNIENVVKIEGAFPDLTELAKEMVTNPEEPCQQVNSSITGLPIKGVRYSSQVKVNQDSVNVNAVESEIRGQVTPYDINPIIYVRYGRPLKETAKLLTVEAEGEDVDRIEGFDYDTYNKLSKKEKIEQYPSSLLKEITLSVPTQKCPSHGCALKLRNMSERTGYRCNRISGADTCLGGVNSFGTGGHLISYFC